MAVPAAPKEGSTETSTEKKAILFCTESDGASGLRATLFKSKSSAVINGERLGIQSVGVEDGEDTALGATTDAAVETDATGSVSGKLRGIVKLIVEKLSPPTTVTVYNVALASADTEYNQALPANCRAVDFRCRTAFDVRFAWVTGKVATPTAPYQTLKSNGEYGRQSIRPSALTLYLATDEAGVVVEIEAWS